MKKKYLAVAVVVIVVAVAGLLLFPCKYGVPIEGFDSPESVSSDGEFYYISNMGKKLKPTAKDGDGYISKLSKKGIIVEAHFLPKEGYLNSPKGLLVDDDVIYVADVDKLIGYNLKTREEVVNIDFGKENTLFLNAIEKKDGETLFISSTDTGKVFEVSLSDNSYRLLAEGMSGPNGLEYDSLEGKLYVVEFGTDGKANGGVGLIDVGVKAPLFHQLTDYRGYNDGLVKVGNLLIFSDWVAFEKKGVLKIFNIDDATLTEYKLPELIGGPADFYLDHESQRLVIPMMIEGKVLIKKFKL